MPSSQSAIQSAAIPILKPKSEDACNSISFNDFCSLLNNLEQCRDGSTKKLDIIFNSKMKKVIQDGSLYPLMRLLLPSNDTERGRYGLKEAAIAKIYIKVWNLSEQSSDAQRLLKWKAPSSGRYGYKPTSTSVIDFCTILEEALKEREVTNPSKLTIKDINAILDDLAVCNGESAKVAKIFNERIVHTLSVNEQKWLMRIIFQDLKIGLKHDQILGRFYKTALKRYNETTNLRTVCEEEGTDAALIVTGIQLFSKFSPMLAKRFNSLPDQQLEIVEKSMNSNPFTMDLKLDGERMLCHIRDNVVFCHSRNGNDITHLYEPLTESIKSLVNSRNCILDGEVLAWNNTTQQFLPFGNNKTIANKEKEEYDCYFASSHNSSSATDDSEDIKKVPEKYLAGLDTWMMFVVFDIIYLKDDNSLPLIEQCISDANQLMLSNGLSMNVSSKSSKNITNEIKGNTVESSDSGIRPVDGDISKLPLIIRRKILDSIVTYKSNRVELVPHKYVFNNDSANLTQTSSSSKTAVNMRLDELVRYFNKTVDNMQEGLVVKNLLSPYIIGENSRTAAHWVKAKPEYGNIRELDLVILGGYFGNGTGFRGSNVISRFLCGVKCPSNNSGELEYRTVCKVGTGYTFEDLKEINRYLAPHWKVFDVKNPPAFLAHWNIGKVDTRPYYYIEPTDSMIVQIKCAQLIDSTEFSAGMACRFPRVERFRYDKAYHECLTLQEVMEIKKTPLQLISSNASAMDIIEQNMDMDQTDVLNNINISSFKKSYKSKKQSSKSTNNSSSVDAANNTSSRHIKNTTDRLFITGNKSQDNSANSSIFEDEVFYIHGMEFNTRIRGQLKPQFTRQNVHQHITSNGGKVVANPVPGCYIVSDADGIRTNYIKERKGHFDIIDVSYIEDCVNSKEKLSLHKSFYYSMSLKTEKAFREDEDVFGDSYSEELHINSFIDLLKHVDTFINAFESSSSSSNPTSSQSSIPSTQSITPFASLVTSTSQPVGSQRDSRNSKKRKLLNDDSISFIQVENEMMLNDVHHVKKLSWKEIALKLETEINNIVMS